MRESRERRELSAGLGLAWASVHVFAPFSTHVAPWHGGRRSSQVHGRAFGPFATLATQYGRPFGRRRRLSCRLGRPLGTRPKQLPAIQLRFRIVHGNFGDATQRFHVQFVQQIRSVHVRQALQIRPCATAGVEKPVYPGRTSIGRTHAHVVERASASCFDAMPRQVDPCTSNAPPERVHSGLGMQPSPRFSWSWQLRQCIHGGRSSFALHVCSIPLAQERKLRGFVWPLFSPHVGHRRRTFRSILRDTSLSRLLFKPFSLGYVRVQDLPIEREDRPTSEPNRRGHGSDGEIHPNGSGQARWCMDGRWMHVWTRYQWTHNTANVDGKPSGRFCPTCRAQRPSNTRLGWMDEGMDG